MASIASAAMLLALACRVSGQSPELAADQARILEAARSSALDFSKKLPNFICTQITHRETTFLGDYPGSVRSGNSSDVIEERLTYYGQKESYQVIAINGKNASGVDRVEFEGTISAGEFGSTLREIFDPLSQTSFSWLKATRQNGRNAYAFRFHVPKENGASVTHRASGQSIVAAFGGEILVDAETMEVLRIHSVLELPKDFPIETSELAVTYQPVNIAGKPYTLPYRSEVRVKDRVHLYVNTIDFKNYQKFTTESTIHYDGGGPP